MVKDLFDQAMMLEVGEQLIIPAFNIRHRESIRSTMYKERMKWQKACKTDEDILISRFSVEEDGVEIFCVKLEKVVNGAITPFIVSKDGKFERLVTVKVKQKENFVMQRNATQYNEDKRIKELMKADGKSEEEITAYFSIPVIEEEKKEEQDGH
ncbi:MAG: hypothetical protein ACTSQA_00535 [Candidatus Heimdallarchaeaceae archaeon]